jgi:hypothetical protein
MVGDTPDGGACGPFPPLQGGIPPLPFDPAWRTPAVRELARAITLDRAYDRLPILADALEEAGCDNPALLNHCRYCEQHLTNCWVLGLVIDEPLSPPPEPAPLPRPSDPIPASALADGGEQGNDWWKLWGVLILVKVVFVLGLSTTRQPASQSTGPVVWSPPRGPLTIKDLAPPEDPDRPGDPPPHLKSAAFDGFHAALTELHRGPYAAWRGFSHGTTWDRHRFGFSLSRHAGGAELGEVGGVFYHHPSPVYYAVPVSKRDLTAPLTASGRLSVRAAYPGCCVSVGWFKSESLRLAAALGPNPVFAESVRRNLLGFRVSRDHGLPLTVCPDAAGTRGWLASEVPHLQPRTRGPYRWELRYDSESSRVTVRLDDEEVTWDLPGSILVEEASFDRFGLFVWEPPPPGTRAEVYLADVRFDGK